MDGNEIFSSGYSCVKQFTSKCFSDSPRCESVVLTLHSYCKYNIWVKPEEKTLQREKNENGREGWKEQGVIRDVFSS